MYTNCMSYTTLATKKTFFYYFMHFVSGQYNSALASDTDKQAGNNTIGPKGNFEVYGDMGRQIICSQYHSTRIITFSSDLYKM